LLFAAAVRRVERPELLPAPLEERDAPDVALVAGFFAEPDPPLEPLPEPRFEPLPEPLAELRLEPDELLPEPDLVPDVDREEPEPEPDRV
jgi:hypothetical protein